jgi:hypothetical protein
MWPGEEAVARLARLPAWRHGLGDWMAQQRYAQLAERTRLRWALGLWRAACHGRARGHALSRALAAALLLLLGCECAMFPFLFLTSDDALLSQPRPSGLRRLGSRLAARSERAPPFPQTVL